MKTKLKLILNSNITYIFLGIFTIIYLFLAFSVIRTSIYDEDDNVFIGTVTKRVITKNKISFTLDGNENLICNYYSDDELEKKKMWDEVPLGSQVQITGTLNKPNNNTIPNTFNYRKYLYYQEIFYTCSIDNIAVTKKPSNPLYIIKNAVVDRIMTYEINDYLYTMIIGDKSLLDEETLERYRDNGVTHLFAISGMHVGLFAAIISAILKKCKLKDEKANIIVTMFIWFYAFLAGFGASVVRAGMLFTFIAIDKICNFGISKIKILLLVGIVLILYDYKIIMDIGFVYSFVTTFGLIYASKIISKHKVIGTSLVACLFSLPITINSFYKFNFASILFNVIFVPFVSVIVYPLCLLTFIIRWIEPITVFMIRLLELLNGWCANIKFLIFVIPKLNIFMIIGYYMLLLIFIRKSFYKTSAILISIVLLNKLQPWFDNNGYVEFLDVGQGDSIIIRSPRNAEVILVDTGGVVGTNSSYKVSDNTITYLYSLGIDRIDYLILTHGDADHLGDALNVISNINVENVILNKGEKNTKEKEIVKSGVNVITKYNGKMNLRFLNDKLWEDENSNSIVMWLKLGEFRFLFMGDATKEVEKYVISKNKIYADVIKLGHHGSKTSSDEGFLTSVKAKVGIISSGRNNRYHHPSEETLVTLEKLKIDYYNTQKDGSIIYKLHDGKVTILTFPP